jgi:TRAP-type mannitol/chloroaromatic compound transport system permease large subunit
MRLFFGWIGIELGVPGMQSLMQALPLRIFGIMANDAAGNPFFTFMGLILERSGMAEDLLDTIGLFGPIRGGLAYAVIWWAPCWRPHRRGGRVGDLDGPDLVADHAALWLRPAHRLGRDRRVGHAGPDPPSLVLIILADQLGKRGRPLQGRLHPRLHADRSIRAVRPVRHVLASGYAPALP